MSGQSAVILAVIVLFGLGTWALVRSRMRQSSTQSGYHVADRQAGSAIGSLSIASTWVWAPALFVASTQSFTNGWVGAAWFIVPNALALVLMLPFALKVRSKYPGGFTLSGLMRRKYGKATQRWYLGGFAGLATLSVAVNLLAGGTVLSMLTGLPLLATTAIFLLVMLTYTYRYGIKASLVTNAVQILLIIGTLAVMVPSTLAITGWDVVAAGMTGVNNITGFFDASGAQVALTFGIISAIGLAAGPVGDQAFWQRAFALRRSEVAKSFGLSALWFTLVPVLMSTFGFVAAGRAFGAADEGYVNLELIQSLLPSWVTVAFMLILCSAMFSVTNSHVLAISSLSSDVTSSLARQRAVMLLAGLAALGIANIPGNSVASMFLIYSTLRSATFLVTVTTLLGVQWNARATSWGIGTGMVFGFPLAVYSNLIVNSWEMRLGAILFTTLAPLVIIGVWSLARSQSREAEPAYRTPAEVMAEREAAPSLAG